MIAALVVAALVVVAAPKAAPKKPRLPVAAVLEIDGLAPVVEHDAVEEALRAALPANGYAVQPKSKTMEALSSVRALGLACDAGDADCLIRIGALGGASIVVKGVLSADGDSYALDLVGVDVNGLKERGRVRVSVANADRRAAVDSALTGVLRPEIWRGLLKVDVSQRGASIIVDGVPRGFAPLSSSIDLTPGPHQLFVGLEGFRAHKQDVVIVYDKETAVYVVLVPGVSEAAPKFTTKKEAPTVEPPPPPPPSKKKPLRIIFYDVETAGVDPRTAQIIGTFLVAELRKREFVSVLDSGELRALVGDGASTKGDARGCSEDQCFAEVAEALGADGVVVSQLTQIEGETLFGLRRIDQKKQEVVSTFLERVPAADDTALLPLVGKSIGNTFAEIPLRAGQTAGVDDSAARVLHPPPLPPILSGSLYVGGAVAGVVGVSLVAIAGANFVTYHQRLREIDEGATSVPADNATLTSRAQQFQSAQLGAGVALGASAVVLCAAVATGWFTDWDGYSQQVRTP